MDLVLVYLPLTVNANVKMALVAACPSDYYIIVTTVVCRPLTELIALRIEYCAELLCVVVTPFLWSRKKPT